MSLAAGLFFITSALQNLNVTLQGLNTWHSFQYLAVVIFLNRLRQARGTIGSATVARFASRESSSFKLSDQFLGFRG